LGNSISKFPKEEQSQQVTMVSYLASWHARPDRDQNGETAKAGEWKPGGRWNNATPESKSINSIFKNPKEEEYQEPAFVEGLGIAAAPPDLGPRHSIGVYF
jgi:hypothetical protein